MLDCKRENCTIKIPDVYLWWRSMPLHFNPHPFTFPSPKHRPSWRLSNQAAHHSMGLISSASRVSMNYSCRLHCHLQRLHIVSCCLGPDLRPALAQVSTNRPSYQRMVDADGPLERFRGFFKRPQLEQHETLPTQCSIMIGLQLQNLPVHSNGRAWGSGNKRGELSKSVWAQTLSISAKQSCVRCRL